MYLIKGIIVFITVLFITKGIGQSYNSFVKTPKEYAILRTNIAPHIDGLQNDVIWKTAFATDSFIQYEPKPFQCASLDSKVKLCYDDNAIYVYAHLYDTPSKIRKELSSRDAVQFSNSDYFTISFDTYNDDQNGTRFIIGANGVQSDSKIFNNYSDFNWNGVWESKVKIVEDGWIAELKIPYYNLRFPKKEKQIWGLQCARYINRLGETDTWTPLDPKINGHVNQWGNMTGLEKINPPIRIHLSPYFAANYQQNETETNQGIKTNEHSKSISGGLDMKVGLNESFTIDATLIPNFGQVKSDNKRLNTTPFEIYYEENRPFFTEGTDLFNKGDIFYSRRIGSEPNKKNNVYESLSSSEVLEANPNETQLYNATKFSGRTNHKLGIGILNAIVAPTYARIRDTLSNHSRTFQTSALTNYNVAVIDQILKNNSSISCINTSTWRNQNERNANVTALLLNFKDKKNKYEWSTMGRMSHVFTPNQKKHSGYTADWSLNKISGNWVWSISQALKDKRWDPSDLGFSQQNNYLQENVNINYNQYEPKKIFQQTNYWLGVNYISRLEPFSYQNVNFNAGFWGKLKNQMTFNYWFNLSPKSIDYFEARQEGKQFKYPLNYNAGINFQLDPRKKMSSAFFIYLIQIPKWKNSYYEFSISPIYKINSHLNLSLNTSFGYGNNEYGYNFTKSDGSFGKRNTQTLNNSIYIAINFTPKSNLTFGTRHYWSKIWYYSFYKLNDDGSLNIDPEYKHNADLSQNYFNLDCIYTWEFAPGSFLNLIWKNSLNRYQESNDIIKSENYIDNVKGTFSSPQHNAITLKLIYFIDYNQARKAFNKKHYK
ncbi:MAG: carbohydrate binding family 9 domain-containing protein [Saprospiraceae bacterium]|jgi:hypothetical protein|nr:carbohydrate binding family 9 domain-containing protein [Saprospiraceae bacterium]